MNFELTNEQRPYFGLDPIQSDWDRVILPGDKFRPESVLYYDGDLIVRQIISTDSLYDESPYNEITRDRNILLPKTSKGKEKKLSAAVFEQVGPTGVRLRVNRWGLVVSNDLTQTKFYSSDIDNPDFEKYSVQQLIEKFIDESPKNHLQDIAEYRNQKRRNVKYKTGDFFSFKLTRETFGFGQILLDIDKVRKNDQLKEEYGFGLTMGKPLIIRFFAFESETRKIDLEKLKQCKSLPAELIQDNSIFYGEYEIIGNGPITDEDYQLPISFQRSRLDPNYVELRWGLINLWLAIEGCDKYYQGDSFDSENYYGHNTAVSRITNQDIRDTIKNGGVFIFPKETGYKKDLRNPLYKDHKEEIFRAFELDPSKSYAENCKKTEVLSLKEIIEILES